jgi:ComF family protein
MGAIYKINRFCYEASRLVMPDLCLLCQKCVWPGTPYCLSCLKAFHREEFKNWIPSQTDENELMPTWAFTTFRGIIPTWVHGLKYRDYPSGFKFVEQQFRKKKQPNVFGDVDGFIPVPLHPLRKRERGFNQSERLAHCLWKNWNIPVLKNGLKRIQATVTQTRLNQEERAQNIEKAIVCGNANAIAGKNWVLVDDVCTTGSTLRACQKALLDAGAHSVQGFVLAWVPRETSEYQATHDG